MAAQLETARSGGESGQVFRIDRDHPLPELGRQLRVRQLGLGHGGSTGEELDLVGVLDQLSPVLERLDQAIPVTVGGVDRLHAPQRFLAVRVTTQDAFARREGVATLLEMLVKHGGEPQIEAQLVPIDGGEISSSFEHIDQPGPLALSEVDLVEGLQRLFVIRLELEDAAIGISGSGRILPTKPMNVRDLAKQVDLVGRSLRSRCIRLDPLDQVVPAFGGFEEAFELVSQIGVVGIEDAGEFVGCDRSFGVAQPLFRDPRGLTKTENPSLGGEFLALSRQVEQVVQRRPVAP